ncbi:MAG: hypothetical protein HZB68_04545 [Candidatus Aenigmarchaeota archaeon]|nr:hypothetical protein [Candidatus Aenigmarchaeota archaeon]
MDFKKKLKEIGNALGNVKNEETVGYLEKALETGEQYLGKGFEITRETANKIFSEETLDSLKQTIRSQKYAMKEDREAKKLAYFEKNMAPILRKHTSMMGEGYVVKEDRAFEENANLHTTYLIRPDTMSTSIGFVFNDDLGAKINVKMDGTLDVQIYDDTLKPHAEGLKKEWGERFGKKTAGAPKEKKGSSTTGGLEEIIKKATDKFGL